MTLLSVDRIAEAARVTHRAFARTPQVRLESLSSSLGLEVTAKVETINPIGCFKGRGVDWWVRCRQPKQVVCATAGNLGQAVGFVCREQGREAHLFVQRGANPRKLAAMARFGAVIHEVGRDFDAAKAEAENYATQQGIAFLDDATDIEVAEGFGGIAVELAEAETDFDALYLPVGSGALAWGCGSWLRAQGSRTRLVGVGAAGAPATQLSFQSGTAVSTDTADTIAAGVAVRAPTAAAVAALQATLDELVLVSDDAIRAAMRALFHEERLVAEPSGALALAGAQAHATRQGFAHIAVVITGANLADSEVPWLLEGN